MKTYRLNANGGQFVGDHTLVMAYQADHEGEFALPTTIGIIEDYRGRFAGKGKVNHVKAYFLKDNFAPNGLEFPGKAAAERAIKAEAEKVLNVKFEESK